MLNQVEFLNWIVKLSFSIQLKFLNSTSQFNLTLFQKKFNSIWYFSSWVLNLNLSTQFELEYLIWTWVLNLNLSTQLNVISLVLYISLILFIKKKDESLRFCINYRKFNALIKWNHYSLSLIDETFTYIQESKYLTQLNIIVAFNKLHMHFDSKDLTIFIIFFDSYKYHVMLFKLINELTFYQH